MATKRTEDCLAALRDAIRQKPEANPKEWLIMAGLNHNFWYDHKEECEKIRDEAYRLSFRDLYGKARRNLNAILDNPEHKDYYKATQFALEHSSYIDAAEVKVLSDATITIIPEKEID